METSELMKNEFSRLKGICYVDHAGSALYAASQIDSVTDDLRTHLFGNPHSTGGPSAYCQQRIDHVRFKILEHFNTTGDKYSVVFTSGATGALKMVAECFAWTDAGPTDAHGDDRPSDGSTFAYTEDNHTSVLGMRELARGANLLCLSRDEAHAALDRREETRPSAERRRDRRPGRGNSLFAYPAQSNFSGTKYPLEWIETCRGGALDRYNRVGSGWYVVLDASSFASTDRLDLDAHTPDFVAVSFYKMFGYPTGLGALLVRNGTAAAALGRKRYFGGGTVEVALARDCHHVYKKSLHERLEDGTVDFLSAIAVGHGLDALRRLAGPMRAVAGRTFALAARLYGRMVGTRHGNGLPVFRVYADTAYRRADEQGGVVNFNALRANGDYVGCNEVQRAAHDRGIVLRVGCFCNPGACQSHLGHTDRELRRNQEVIGHVCGDHIDLIDGRPTGSVRVSFGYHSSESDADKVYDTLVKAFRQNDPLGHVDRRQRPDITVDEYNEMDLRVSRIFVYPIKSCGAFETDEWQLESYGFLYDRNWAVVSDSGICMTQLQEPKLCMVRPSIDLQKRTMTLVYADNEDEVPMVVPLDTKDDGVEKSGKICWGGSIEGIDCGDEVAAWLGRNVDRPGLRLVRCTGRNPPDVNNYGHLDKSVLGANQCQYLLTSDSTLKWLRKEMENDVTEIDEDNLLFRFRCNVVISGDDLPAYAELTWRKLTVGAVGFRQDSACERCKMVNIDQDTSDTCYKPLSVLARHKRRGKSVFGVYLARDFGGDGTEDAGRSIRVGERCTVTERCTADDGM